VLYRRVRAAVGAFPTTGPTVLRRWTAAAVTLLAVVLAATGCRGSEGPDRAHSSGVPAEPIPGGPVSAAAALRPGQGALDQCALGKRGGGYDVWIKGIPCSQARQWVLRLVPVVGNSGVGKHEGISALENGWECWSRVEGRYGPVHNVCVRGEQLVMFYFA
jgi:hypothetical protein